MEAWMDYWRTAALRAGAAIILGIIAFLLPGITLTAIVLLFGFYAAIDGALNLMASFREMRTHGRWGVLLVEGIFGIAAGAIVLLWPGIGALALTLVVGAWAFATGVMEIIVAIRLRRVITGEWLLILSGVLSIAFGIALALFPGIGALALIWWLGAFALAYGIVLLTLALRIRHLSAPRTVAAGPGTPVR